MQILAPILSLEEIQHFLRNELHIGPIRPLQALYAAHYAERLLNLGVGIVKLVDLVNTRRIVQLLFFCHALVLQEPD